MTTSERTVSVPTPDGPMTTHLIGAEDDPPVIVLMAAPGVTDGLLSVAREVAGHGYRAVVPDLYHHFGEGIVFEGSDPRMRETMARLSDAMVVEDVRAVLDRLGGGPAGVVGFCMGGRFVVRAMAAFPDRLIAGSALHPTRLRQDGDDSPHLGIPRITGRLYVGFGEQDPVVPPDQWDAVREVAPQAPGEIRIEVHPGADHGFALPGPRFHPEAAAASWAATYELWGDALRQAGTPA
ncbi:MAG: dienelactone hydrolase family protein [Solirubrobacteraceae bacterium]|nr:dienelactone hydrolase family protein [Solirubrobacteraceae bacterium]